VSFWTQTAASLLSAGILIGSGYPSAAQGTGVVRLAYDPRTTELDIYVVPPGDASVPELEPPQWLTRTGSTGYCGSLSEAAAGSDEFGVAGEEAYLFGVLEWLDGLADFELLLSVPASHRAIATGRLIDERIGENTYEARFALAGRGNTAIFIGPYLIGEDRSGEIVLRTYFKPAQAAHSQSYLRAVAGYLARYQREIGAYPFASFSVVSAPIPVGYGFGGLTYVSERILDHPYMLGRSLAHEVLHSWWGGAVAVDAASGNWAEGLTTYQADYALAVDRGPAAARDMRRAWLAALSALPAAADRPLRDFVAAGHGADQSVGYGKAAMLFHMLDLEIGETATRDGLRRFWQQNRGGSAGWLDLRAAFERSAGRDLGWFFEQWLDRPGLPALRPVSAEARRRGDGFSLVVTLEQEVPSYRLSVPVSVATETGELSRIVTMQRRTQSFEIVLPSRPLTVSVDPGFNIARKLAEEELPPTVRDVLRARSVAVVAGDGASDAAAAVARGLLGPKAEVTRADPGRVPARSDAVLVIGTSEDVAAIRSRHLARPAPDISRSGRTRAWVERGAHGRPWLFASSVAPDALAEDLAALRYYAAQSFLVLGGAAEPTSGRWLVERNPVQVWVD